MIPLILHGSFHRQAAFQIGRSGSFLTVTIGGKTFLPYLDAPKMFIKIAENRT